MQTANPRILTLNGGSSSVKFALFNPSLTRILEGEIERIGHPDSSLRMKGLKETDSFTRPLKTECYKQAIEKLAALIEERNEEIIAHGHRVVHGGPKYFKPELITDEMIKELKLFSAYDPQHMPQEIQLIETFHRHFPNVPQFACFDTAFHHEMPLIAKMLPIPRSYEAKGIYRYGFHGLSYEYLMSRLSPQEAKSKIILAHLGNGASLAAVKEGKSIDTSMSFTPAAGVPMGSRSGDLDPGLVWYLSRSEGLDSKKFNEMINFKSGLLGISETSSDMRELLDKSDKDPRAKDAIEIFCYEIKKRIGAYSAALGGLDTLVFSGGIGENAKEIRSGICEGLEFLGIHLDEKQNANNQALISKKEGKVTIRVIHTDEEWIIANTVLQKLRKVK